MTQILNLPLNDDNKFIVVDEGVDVTYAENLIIAWLQTISKKDVNRSVNILLFSKPKYCLDKYFKFTDLKNIHVEDYYNADLESEEINVYDKLINFITQQSNTIIVLDCLNTLALQIGISSACRVVEKLFQYQNSQVFCIYRRNFYQNIPRIETLGNIYIKLIKSKITAYKSKIYYEVSVIQKKPGGSIVRSSELIEQDVDTYNLECIKISDVNTNTHKPVDTILMPQASFRMEMNEREIKQRESVPLPYILPGNPGRESKIIYVPDDADDLDEEDPDDDLDV